MGVFAWYLILKIFNNKEIGSLEQAVRGRIWRSERVKTSENIEAVE